MRPTLALTAAVLALTGCAGGPSAVDLEPAAARTATVPYEWFAENWGPFDIAMNRGSMLIVDGVQTRGVGPDGRDVQTALGGLTPEDIVRVQPIPCGAGLFGEAGRNGVILVFTTRYEGPLPERGRVVGPDVCGEDAPLRTEPLEWFAENWGPFDPALTMPAAPGRRGRTLVLVDGVQLSAEQIEAQSDASGPSPLTREQIWHIRVIKHRCDVRLFGEAAERGIIMLFTYDYDGPMPGPGHPWDGSPCAGGGR